MDFKFDNILDKFKTFKLPNVLIFICFAMVLTAIISSQNFFFQKLRVVRKGLELLSKLGIGKLQNFGFVSPDPDFFGHPEAFDREITMWFNIR